MMNEKLALKVSNLKKSFDGTEFVLNGLNLEIPRGKITVLIGFSGTGKSVLVKHFLGLEKPTSGDVEVLGSHLGDLNEYQLMFLRQKFGVLFQNAALFDDMNSIENVMF